LPFRFSIRRFIAGTRQGRLETGKLNVTRIRAVPRLREDYIAA
jgi:hypothetical protein